MEEKKRVRPTWAMIKALEDKVKEKDELLQLYGERYSMATDKVDVLEKSNKLMEQELDRLRDELETQRKNNKKHWILWQKLKRRGFWARLFNRQ